MKRFGARLNTAEGSRKTTYKRPPFSPVDEQVIAHTARTMRQRVINFYRHHPLSKPIPFDLAPPKPTPQRPKEISVAVALRLQKPGAKAPRSYLPPDAPAPDVGPPTRY